MKTADTGSDLRRGAPSTLLFLRLLSMALLVRACHAGAGSGDLHPLVLIPGNGGNQLEARLTEEYRPSSIFCHRWARRRGGAGGWFRLWFDPSVVVAPFTRCFAERMTLHYHRELDDYRNAPGVEIRVPHFGSTLGLLYLDPHLRCVRSN